MSFNIILTFSSTTELSPSISGYKALKRNTRKHAQRGSYNDHKTSKVVQASTDVCYHFLTMYVLCIACFIHRCCKTNLVSFLLSFHNLRGSPPCGLHLCFILTSVSCRSKGTVYDHPPKRTSNYRRKLIFGRQNTQPGIVGKRQETYRRWKRRRHIKDTWDERDKHALLVKLCSVSWFRFGTGSK